MCLFLFKQKTAYDMRISDWSSDVCSSDLSTVIDRLTMWVIEAAARQYLELSAINLAVPIAVNVSAKNLHSLAFPDEVESLMRRQIGRASCRERVCQYV